MPYLKNLIDPHIYSIRSIQSPSEKLRKYLCQDVVIISISDSLSSGFQCAGGALPYQQCSRGYFANITGM